MPSSSGPTVHDVLDDVSLGSIGFFRLLAEHLDDADGDGEEVEVDPKYLMTTETRDDRKGFRVSLDTSITAGVAHVRCTVHAEYELDQIDAEDIRGDTMQEFVNNVALMNILPFVRQGIADLTQRVFNAPLFMPIIKRGDLTFTLPGSAD